MLDSVAQRFLEETPDCDFASIRVVRVSREVLAVRRGVVQPPRLSEDLGAMIGLQVGDGTGYAGTCDLTRAGLRRAASEAARWARCDARRGCPVPAPRPHPPAAGSYRSRVETPWDSVPRLEKIGLLREASARLRADPCILDWGAEFWHADTEKLLVRLDGGRAEQHFSTLLPTLRATANRGAETQTRSLGADAHARQGGLEILEEIGFGDAASRIGRQAVALLSAPDCPTGVMDLVLAPDQMILQIHESIGHPLELDRILGDERNYAGSSFVSLDMFGTYRYGSELLNVSFDPTRPGELASYGFDDEGQPATREPLIRRGILLRALGGATSQARAGVPGVANSLACGWHRPPIDRIGNLNLEPGTSSLDALIARVERGVYMETNASWSIDDARNKFQFGCEWGRRIADGQLREVVKNPNYRGRSAEFWRSLAGVGDASTLQVLGTLSCGKGEPNQAIGVGHAAPACLFTGVDVFGGA